ncbi:Pre-rRNA-processing protein TSR2-like protein [Platysternon megacephalum]|uniref:Pre-rRNA-processing protein TSR2 homolog n=1 Tax=Platysternon megacephalum TaxID=55544 RepID=A0A4D9DLV5_9SAUR|nr:Pre-rRNA-processing protein TSR2-like protein [Platysternon megacephalum]
MAAPREETRGLFGQGVRAVLGSWAALQIAVEHGFGGAHGREKAEWMVGAVEQYFHSNAALEPDEVEDFLAEVLNNEFDTIIEDGSLAEVSQQLQSLFARCQRGEGPALTETIARLTRRQQEVGRAAAQARPAQGSSSEEEEEERPEEVMDCSSPGAPPDPPPAEDGWTVVRKKKK